MKDDTPQEQRDKEAIGKKILEHRVAQGKSQDDLSEAMGYRISRKAIHSFEAGTDHIRTGHLFTICGILRISPMEILPDWLLEKTDPFLFHYQHLPPDEREHLESYLRFLTEEQRSRATEKRTDSTQNS